MEIGLRGLTGVDGGQLTGNDGNYGDDGAYVTWFECNEGTTYLFNTRKVRSEGFVLLALMPPSKAI